MAKLFKIASEFRNLCISVCFLAGFEPVKTLFERNFAEKREQGAQVCAYYKGKKKPAAFFFFFLTTSELPWLYSSDLPWL
jgi:hypothetical protein